MTPQQQFRELIKLKINSGFKIIFEKAVIKHERNIVVHKSKKFYPGGVVVEHLINEINHDA